jgi:uncharacterized membrane protein HdeD (DUF308 family)
MGTISDRITAEPVRFWSVLTGIVTAIFGIILWAGASPELMGLVLVVWAAVGTLFQFFFVRNKVTPT